MSSKSQKKDLLPVYLIVGSDKLRRNAVIERLNERMQDYGDMSFNSTQFDIGSSGPQIAASQKTADFETNQSSRMSISSEIINACNTMPFAANKRYVQVNNADKLSKEETDQLIAYIEAPSDTCVLVLIANKLAKNTRLYKVLSGTCVDTIIECEAPKAYELASNLTSIARSHNGSITPDAAKKLIELIGTDTTALDSEIKRLLLATNDNNITIQHVLNNTAKTDSAKPWSFVNYFSARNLSACVNTFRSMEENAPYILLPMICNRVKEMMYVQSLIESGQPTNQNIISKELHMAPWQCKNHGAWARTFSAQNLRQILSDALNCEADIKSGSKPNIRFEMFIVEALS